VRDPYGHYAAPVSASASAHNAVCTHYAAPVGAPASTRQRSQRCACPLRCTRQRVGQRIERPERRIFSLSSAFPRPPRHLRPRRLHHWNRTAEAHTLLFFFGPAPLMLRCRLGRTPTGPRAPRETTTSRPSVRRAAPGAPTPRGVHHWNGPHGGRLQWCWAAGPPYPTVHFSRLQRPPQTSVEGLMTTVGIARAGSICMQTLKKMSAKWFCGLVVVSRFFCFPIQMNFAEKILWPSSPVWRAPH